MGNFVLKGINGNNIKEELDKIGFDKNYAKFAQKKFEYKNIKIYNLTPVQANIIKQTALAAGSDCATNKDVITGNINLSDVILGGSLSQLKRIAEKLSFQPFKLKELGIEILNFIERNYKNKTKIVGILNVTPDSFSDGGAYINPKNAQEHFIKLIQDGADMIDIGAESTKPFSSEVSSEEQIKRLKPILEFINKENISIPISIDTRNSIVADFALNNSVSVINDVSGFDFDSKMPEVISRYGAGVVIQHSYGTPENMQINPKYNSLIDEIFLNLKEKQEIALSYGIKNIILDPGIGFGKTKENNFEILNRIEEFYALNSPIMVGLSRKSLLGVSEEDNDLKDVLSAALAYPLMQKGVDFLRVHNVELHKKILQFT